jgi:hypothetical protein
MAPFFDRSTPVCLGLPNAFRNLCLDARLLESLAECFGIIPLISGDDVEAFAGVAPIPDVEVAGAVRAGYFLLVQL